MPSFFLCFFCCTVPAAAPATNHPVFPPPADVIITPYTPTTAKSPIRIADGAPTGSHQTCRGRQRVTAAARVWSQSNAFLFPVIFRAAGRTEQDPALSFTSEHRESCPCPRLAFATSGLHVRSPPQGNPSSCLGPFGAELGTWSSNPNTQRQLPTQSKQTFNAAAKCPLTDPFSQSVRVLFVK